MHFFEAFQNVAENFLMLREQNPVVVHREALEILGLVLIDNDSVILDDVDRHANEFTGA